LQAGFRGASMYHGILCFPAKIAAFVHKQGMIRPGDRVGVAVSGGADSVALLRALVELGRNLGCVLTVVHFNHKIRMEADSDAEFVKGLARELGLECFVGEGDAKKFARERRVSLETAARELRYQFFSQLGLDKIATAHTLDDQAETVLMKVLRGAGTQGMSGIWPKIRRQEAGGRGQEKRDQDQTQGPSTRSPSTRSLRMTNLEIIRPMLSMRRREVEEYLRSLGQEWREDATNRDVKHTRNKVRHELLPLLEREYNPNIYQQLADAAEVARGEEEFWEQEIRRQEAGGRRQEKKHSAFSGQQPEKQVPRSAPDDNFRREGAGGSTQEKQVPHSVRDDDFLNVELLSFQPVAVRRRVVRAAFHQASGKSLDFEHTDELVRFLDRRESSRLQLPEYWFAVLDWPKRRVTFEERQPVNDGTRKAGITSKKKGRIAARKV